MADAINSLIMGGIVLLIIVTLNLGVPIEVALVVFRGIPGLGGLDVIVVLLAIVLFAKGNPVVMQAGTFAAALLLAVLAS